MKHSLEQEVEERLVRLDVVSRRRRKVGSQRGISNLHGWACAIEALVIGAPREGVKCVPAVAREIATLRRVADDEHEELTVVKGRTDRVHTRTAVRAGGCEKAEAGAGGAKLVEQATAGRGELGSGRLELLLCDCHVGNASCQPPNGRPLTCGQA